MRQIFWITAVFAIFLVSCTKQDRENTIISQEAAIDTYISSLSGVTVIRNNGANRVVLTAGSGEVATVGDSLYIKYAGYIFSNGKGGLFVTNDSTIALENGFHPQASPEKIKLGETDLISGLKTGLEGVTQGEHCYILFSAKYGYNNTVVYNVPKLSPLFFEVWIDKVIK